MGGWYSDGGRDEENRPRLPVWNKTPKSTPKPKKDDSPCGLVLWGLSGSIAAAIIWLGDPASRLLG